MTPLSHGTQRPPCALLMHLFHSSRWLSCWDQPPYVAKHVGGVQSQGCQLPAGSGACSWLAAYLTALRHKSGSFLYRLYRAREAHRLFSAAAHWNGHLVQVACSRVDCFAAWKWQSCVPFVWVACVQLITLACPAWSLCTLPGRLHRGGRAGPHCDLQRLAPNQLLCGPQVCPMIGVS